MEVDTEEVTFRDLMDGTGKSKAGYSKTHSTEARPIATAYNTFGSTPAVLTNTIAPSFRRLST